MVKGYRNAMPCVKVYVCVGHFVACAWPVSLVLDLLLLTCRRAVRGTRASPPASLVTSYHIACFVLWQCCFSCLRPLQRL